MCWGWNYFGQLGIGNNTNMATPVTVPGNRRGGGGREGGKEEEQGFVCVCVFRVFVCVRRCARVRALFRLICVYVCWPEGEKSD
jgi:hypothetical protein